MSDILLALAGNVEQKRAEYERSLKALLDQVRIEEDLGDLADGDLAEIYRLVRADLKRRGFLA